MSDISAVNPYPTPGTGATRAGTGSGSSSATDAMADQLGADVFLQLLVAQLKYQDPTSPADGTQFLAQTAQFTMVEKLTQLAEQSEADATVNRNLGAAALVGRSITWLADDGTVAAGTVDAARLGSAGPVLVVDGAEVPFDTVASVEAAGPAPTTAPAPSPSTAPTPSNSPSTETTSETTDASTTTFATDGTNGADAS